MGGAWAGCVCEWIVKSPYDCIVPTHHQALKRRGLKTGGRKEELLARLREDIQRAQQEERGLMMQVCMGRRLVSVWLLDLSLFDPERRIHSTGDGAA